MKEVIKAMFRSVGLDVRRIQRAPEPDETVPASPRRPIGNIELFLQDIKARGFVPRGIIDVGANLGLWTRMALSVFPDARVLMIEPLDEMQRSLSRLVKERPACSYVNAGAGRQDGESTLTISWNLVSGSFLPDTETELLASRQQRRTRMVTIDTLLRGAFGDFEPDLVKLDIQGFELEALAGAESLFGRTEVFILETSLFSFKPRSPITRQCISFMADREYELYDITEYLRRPLDGALGQIDIAFVKRHGMFRRDGRWIVE